MSLRFSNNDDGCVDPDRVRLFLFQTSKSWPRSGGGYAVIAKSFKEAVSMFPREKGAILHDFFKEEPTDGQRHYHTWVLVDVMETFEMRSKVVFANWHVS